MHVQDSIRRMSETPTTTTSQKVRRYISSNCYGNELPISIAVLSVALSPEEREILSVLLPFV